MTNTNEMKRLVAEKLAQLQATMDLLKVEAEAFAAEDRVNWGHVNQLHNAAARVADALSDVNADAGAVAKLNIAEGQPVHKGLPRRRR